MRPTIASRKRLSKENTPRHSASSAKFDRGKNVSSNKPKSRSGLIPGKVIGHLRAEFIPPAAFALEHGLPELFRRRVEDQVERCGIGQPGLSFHFLFKLAAAPAGI